MTIIQSPTLADLIEFEMASWDPEEQADPAELEHRLSVFPQGVFMLYDNALSVSQLTVLPKTLPARDEIEGFEHLKNLPIDQSARTLWAANMATRRNVGRGKGYATELLAHVIEWAAEYGFVDMAGCATCHRFAEMLAKGRVASIDEYMARGMNPAVRTFNQAAAIARSHGCNCTAWHLPPKANAWTDASSAGWGVTIGITINK